MTLEATIVIPTYRRPDSLQRCLQAISAQTLPLQQLEVIVVDDDPQRSAAQLIRQHYRWARVAYGQGGSPGAARNLGAALAQAPLIIFTDDDCLPQPHWAEAYVAAAAHHSLMNGPTTCLEGCRSPFDAAPVNLDGQMAFSCNFACQRKVFYGLGGFDERFRGYGFEDYDFFERAHASQIHRHFVATASVDHPPRRLPRASGRVRALANYFFYQLKHGHTPSLHDALRQVLGPWRHRLRRPCSAVTLLRAWASLYLELWGTLTHYDSALTRAQELLHS